MKGEGVRRLSIFLGGVGSSAWFVYVLFASDGFSKMGIYGGWLALFGGLVVCFFPPYVLVKVINWVIRGFGQDKSKNGE